MTHWWRTRGIEVKSRGQNVECWSRFCCVTSMAKITNEESKRKLHLIKMCIELHQRKGVNMIWTRYEKEIDKKGNRTVPYERKEAR